MLTKKLAKLAYYDVKSKAASVKNHDKKKRERQLVSSLLEVLDPTC